MTEWPPIRHEFMSPAWIAAARQVLTRALSRHVADVNPFTLSEEFDNPPEHLDPDNDGTIGFTVRVGHGEVTVTERPARDADLRVISDYAEALKVARNPNAPADLAEVERRIAEGRLRIEGDPWRMPAILQQLDLHGLLSGMTA